MKFDQNKAKELLRAEAAIANKENTDPEWIKTIENFSKLCQEASRTHIAFLGTAILAKALNLNVDVFAVKAGADGEGSYSARSLCHGALVPLATELGINLGVTGREPLNNQPYFRISVVTRDIPVHGSAKHILIMLCDLLEKLASTSKQEDSLCILRSFIFIRRQYQPKYLAALTTDTQISTDQLIKTIQNFVNADSEGGKRAQAVAAGLMSLFAGPDRVEVDRINDPDKHLPGDIGVRSNAEIEGWEKILEVRDKPVSLSDFYVFAGKALEAGVEEAAILAVASNQKPLDFEEARLWAQERGLGLSLFLGWQSFVQQALFWSEQSQSKGASLVASLIYNRLVFLEVSETGATTWLNAFTPVAQ